MIKTKDRKPRQKRLDSFTYERARYLADFLCDPETPTHLTDALNFAMFELSILTDIQIPPAEPTPKSWEAIRRTYLDMHRAFEAACEKAGISPHHVDIAHRRQQPKSHTTLGVFHATALALVKLLHDYSFSDLYPPPQDEYHEKTYPRPNESNSRLLCRKVEEARAMRLLIEEFGQQRVIEAVSERGSQYIVAAFELQCQILNRPLKDFITGKQFRVELHPQTGKAGER